MASLGNPRSWGAYMNTKDCSLGFCSFYCPQWCYTHYPPPPPSFEFPHQNSIPNLSPLLISIIGILTSAFLLVTYYTLISNYCGGNNNNTQSSSSHELQDIIRWQEVSHSTGLDEALIKSITICKYKKGDGLVCVSDCSVCLTEFEDDESIKLLPKCSHAFHLSCIDTWLQSHSSCPLCRSPIFTFNNASVLIMENIPSQNQNQHQNENLADGRDNIEVAEEESTESSSTVVKPSLRAFSDLSNLQGRRHNRVIEIREEGYEYEYHESIRRSVSMDHSFQSGVSVANVAVPLPLPLKHMNQVEEEECCEEAAPSNTNYGRRVLNLKRSFSSGRFSFSLSRNGRGGRQGINIIPL